MKTKKRTAVKRGKLPQLGKVGDPSCHACGAPIVLYEKVAIYHEKCDPQLTLENVEKEFDSFYKDFLNKD